MAMKITAITVKYSVREIRKKKGKERKGKERKGKERKG